MGIKVLDIDLGKAVCSHAGLDEAGAVVFRKRLQRHRLLDILATLPPCVVAMEVSGGAHLMAKLANLATPEVRAATGFHGDNATRQQAKE